MICLIRLLVYKEMEKFRNSPRLTWYFTDQNFNETIYTQADTTSS
jgi:hypothetical protein